MFMKKEWVAMLLAGGQGSRLYALTKKLAKPAVPFGGKYRIIDFPLSNCVNSGIDTVGVLTQYQPLVLNEYLGNGQPWDLDRLNGGVFVLPPYQKSSGSDWYTGTANAICQNIPFIERYDPEYVLILSGDHIYKMDYTKMLAHHKKMGADCTIAVFEVPMEEASRFGIMNTREDTTVYEFEEKPKNPKSNLASMGVYIFSWKKLREYLLADDADADSEKDFGKNIIPKMLSAGEKLVAYSLSEPSTACGRPIWTCWTPRYRWTFMTPAGRFTAATPACRRITSPRAPRYRIRWSPRAARLPAMWISPSSFPGCRWPKTPWWIPAS